MHRRLHRIIHTYIDKHGHLGSSETSIHGATCGQAMKHFQDHVDSASTNKRLIGVILIDVNDVVLAEWSANTKGVAA